MQANKGRDGSVQHIYKDLQQDEAGDRRNQNNESKKQGMESMNTKKRD